MNAMRITLRSLVRRRVCFGGLRRRTWRYHGLCPWGSMFDVQDGGAKKRLGKFNKTGAGREI